MEYFIADIIGAIPWMLCFVLRSDLRKEMITMSILAMPLAVFDLLMVPTYWKPVTFLHIPVGIEAFIYTFELGGICSVIYQEVSDTIPIKIAHYHKSIAIVVLTSILPVFIFLEQIHKLNRMINLDLALVVAVILLVYLRRDLLKSALLGAVIFGGIYFLSLFLWLTLFPQVSTWFTVNGMPRFFIGNIPGYELLFGIIFSAFWGNLYELLFGYRLRHKRK